MTDPAPSQVLTFVSTAASNLYTVTTTAVIPVGSVVAMGMNRSVTSTSNNGVASMSQSAGAITWNLGATGSRATTHDMTLEVGIVTTAIPVGTTITMTTVNTTSTRRTAIFCVFNDITSATPQTFSDQTTGTTGATSSGDNGSGLTATTTVDAAATTANVIDIAIFSTGGTVNTTPGTGMTLVGEAKTAAGSTDRGVLMAYKIIRSATGTTPSATADYDGTQSWAAASATYPITASAVTIKGKVVVGGVKKTVASRTVIVGGVKKTVANISVIVGGVKKPLA